MPHIQEFQVFVTFIETSPKTPTPQSSQSDVKISMVWTRNGEESTLPPNIDT